MGSRAQGGPPILSVSAILVAGTVLTLAGLRYLPIAYQTIFAIDCQAHDVRCGAEAAPAAPWLAGTVLTAFWFILLALALQQYDNYYRKRLSGTSGMSGRWNYQIKRRLQRIDDIMAGLVILAILCMMVSEAGVILSFTEY